MIDVWQQHDIAPPWPTTTSLSAQLTNRGLTPTQRTDLVQHSIARACRFADLPLLSFLLESPLSQGLVNLSVQDEDGLGLISQSIICFGDESERDVDREECIRFLVAHKVSVDIPDNAGWTPLHHAALRAPPTLVVHLLMHGASPLATSHRSLTPLDIITAYQPLPDRQDVTLLLEVAMREQGWKGSPLALRRQQHEKKRAAKAAETSKRVTEWDQIGRVLGMGEAWWGDNHDQDEEDEDASDPTREDDSPTDDITPEEVYTPPRDYTNMLVFSPITLPSILQCIILDAEPLIYPVSQRSAPANAIYLLSRFACLECDASWFDQLLTGAVDRIEEVVYARPDRSEDMAHLAFWLYNSTLLLHLLKTDRDLYDMCDALDLFSLMEDLINAIYVFVLRGVEKRIDPLIDAALLDYSSLSSDFEPIEFESDWSFFRSLTGPRRKQTSPLNNGHMPPAFVDSTSKSLHPPGRPSSPPSSAKAFNSLRQTMARSSHPSVSTIFPVSSPTPSQYPSNGRSSPTLFSTSSSTITPNSITAVLSSIHSLLSLYSINPALVIQAHSQVLYWVSCEVFNRILTRKKYLCRSRAMQIALNISVLEEWVGSVGLPSGVGGHFAAVRELLSWLQCHSSIDQFLSLVDTIQTMRALNPLQMRRAVRDYRYEVNETRMSEECVQYLAQLQKDWERRRVKMGVEALRKEIGERKNRDRSESTSVVSSMGGTPPPDTSSSSLHSLEHDTAPSPTLAAAASLSETQSGIDSLFDRNQLKNEWSSPKPPDPLGELLDSTFMLPLALPSDPEMLAAWPGPTVAYILEQENRMRKRQSRDLTVEGARSASRASVGNRGAMEWRLRAKTMRAVEAELVEWVDGGVHVQLDVPEDRDDEELDEELEEDKLAPEDSFTSYMSASPLRPSASQRRRSMHPRESTGGSTIVPEDYARDVSLTPERTRH